MELKDYITIGAIVVTLLLGLFNLMYSIANNRKTIFINTVTKLRSEWLYNMKEYLSKFLYTYQTIFQNTAGEIASVFNELDNCFFVIKLNINPRDNFDKNLIKLMEKMVGDIKENYPNNLTPNMKKDFMTLITVSQGMAKFEWEGIKQESHKGSISKRRKNRLRETYLKEYEDMLLS